MSRFGILTIFLFAAFAASLLFSTYQLYRRRLPKLVSDDSWGFDFNDISRKPTPSDAESKTNANDSAAEALQELASLVFGQRDFLQAATLFRRALTIREQAQGLEHPDVANVLQGLGASLRLSGEIAEAEPLLKRALAIRERSLGPEHPAVANA